MTLDIYHICVELISFYCWSKSVELNSSAVQNGSTAWRFVWGAPSTVQTGICIRSDWGLFISLLVWTDHYIFQKYNV